MKTPNVDLLLSDLLLDSLQVTYPNIIGYERILRDGCWIVQLHTIDDEDGVERFRESGSHISPFLAAEDAARLFLSLQEEPEWAFPPKS